MNEKGFVSEKRFVSKKNLSRAWRRLFGKVLNSKEEIEANTSENMIAGAEAVKEVYSSLVDQPTFEYDETGKITGYKTKIGGADTVFPFNAYKVSVIDPDTTSKTYTRVSESGFKAVFVVLVCRPAAYAFWCEKYNIRYGTNAIKVSEDLKLLNITFQEAGENKIVIIE